MNRIHIIQTYLQDATTKQIFKSMTPGKKSFHQIISIVIRAAYTICNAHGLDILDLDFNPNKQYYFLSAGEDC